MTATAKTFIQFARAHRVIEFGDFKLKSGRSSPYFFNLGAVSSGSALTELGRFYADAIVASGIEFDVIFGPAYKGIPIASITASCLHQYHGTDKAIAYNRKEAKDHGEGGQLVGAALTGQRVLILDDVITAGTAVREALALIADAGGTTVGIAVGFDRQEQDPNGDSAIAALERKHRLSVICIADFNDLLECAEPEQRARLESHCARYGATRANTVNSR